MRAKREYFANNSPRGLIFAKRIRRLGGTASLAILAKITIIAESIRLEDLKAFGFGEKRNQLDLAHPFAEVMLAGRHRIPPAVAG